MALSPRFALALCTLQVLLNVALYWGLLPGAAEGAVIGTAFNPFSACLAGIAAAALAWLLWKLARSEAFPFHSPIA